MHPYRTADWTKFRAEVLRLDGDSCSACGRDSSKGIVLHVHHKQYLAGHAPWEYPYELCEALCSGCHAAAHGLIPPKFGWEHVGWDDLEDLVGTCECCGTSIRYVFMVQHPNWRAMEVGEICCDNLTSSQVASGMMESKRRYSERLKRFVSSPRWSARPGDVKHITQKGLNIEVVPSDQVFRLRIEWQPGKKTFATVLDAKIKVFELIESGVINEYLVKRTRRRREV